jgi:pimeloyl-ACP methyl ester carboxylesterase
MQSTDRFIESDGLRIHYLDWGSGHEDQAVDAATAERQPLLLLHGIGRTAHNFDHLAPHFAHSYRVIAPDLRGHGDSDWHPDAAYLVEDYVRDVEALISELGLANIALWGQSTGGRVAQVIAGKFPELVAAAVIEDVGPERPREVSDRRAKRMGDEADGWATYDELLLAIQPRYPLTPEPVLRHFILHGTKRRPDGRLVWKCDPNITKGFIPTEIWRHVREIQAPIIYILGGASNIVPAETQAELKEALLQVEIVTMPGLGHYPSDEKPEEFLEIVEGFLG